MGGKYPPGEKRAQDSGGQVYTLHSGLMGGSPCSDRAGHLGIAPVYRSHLHLLHYCGECPPTPTRRGAPCPLSGRDCGQTHPLPTFPSSGGSLCPNWACFLIFIMKGDLKSLLLKVQGQLASGMAGSRGYNRVLWVPLPSLGTSLAPGFHPFWLPSSSK